MWIPQLPPSLWWSHNAYYHRWLLRHLPARMDRVLEVGCGAGDLARALAGRTHHVDAVDRSEVMIKRARTRPSNVNWLLGDLLDGTLPLHPDGYDVVTSVASLHHMPLHDALRRLAGLVRPGGLLAVIGMCRSTTIGDYAMDAVSLPTNAVVGAVLAAKGQGGKKLETGMPVLDPTITLPEIKEAAARHTPGALLRRRLFFRYTLLWRRRITSTPEST